MSIYGYKKSVVDQRYGLLELREVSFEFNPKDLRRIACFLEHFADELEQRNVAEQPRAFGMLRSRLAYRPPSDRDHRLESNPRATCEGGVTAVSDPGIEAHIARYPRRHRPVRTPQ